MTNPDDIAKQANDAVRSAEAALGMQASIIMATGLLAFWKTLRNGGMSRNEANGLTEVLFLASLNNLQVPPSN